MICCEYGGWDDEKILVLPYFRFCQIITRILKRRLDDIKLDAKLIEISTKYLASIIVNTSWLSIEGKREVLNSIKEFTLLGKDEMKKEIKKEDKFSDIKTGSFERMLSLFGGIK